MPDDVTLSTCKIPTRVRVTSRPEIERSARMPGRSRPVGLRVAPAIHGLDPKPAVTRIMDGEPE